jgi:hypothetical protein
MILRTCYGGQTWDARSSDTSSDFYDLSFADVDTGLAVGTNDTVLWTTDGQGQDCNASECSHGETCQASLAPDRYGGFGKGSLRSGELGTICKRLAAIRTRSLESSRFEPDLDCRSIVGP